MSEVNVKVAVRIRPLLPKEKLKGEQTCVKVIPASNQLVIGKQKTFTFDHILSSKVTQEDVYSECVSPLVKCCFDGYNATVFAYGQTGSGKTFTVGGSNLASQSTDMIGIIPRAVSHVYEVIKNHPQRDITVKVSYIEVYKEELRDLLDSAPKDIVIREDNKGNTVVVGAAEVVCESMDDVISCIERGAMYRHTGSTQMNEVSSRSHSIFTILLEQAWEEDENPAPHSVVMDSKGKHPFSSDDFGAVTPNSDVNHYMCAKFHFVDLAGSERANRTKNIGDRFKESVHINSGLLTLGNVISALADPKKKLSHIPYRESKITRLLKDSLGGNANTVMICCISPAASNFDESLNALKYANRAKNITNKPIVNRDPQSIRFEEMQSEIRALREELHRQRTSVMTFQAEIEPQHVVKEAKMIKQLEKHIIELQREISHYRFLADEAFKQLTDIKDRNILTDSLEVQLSEWMKLVDEVQNSVPATVNKDTLESQVIRRLEKELDNYKRDLASDEEIFAEKTHELSELQTKYYELESNLNVTEEEVTKKNELLKHQENKLIQQQMQIQDLLEKLKLEDDDKNDAAINGVDYIEEYADLELNDLDVSTEQPVSNRRAKSVPAHMLGNRSAREHSKLKPVPIRKIKTSPALFSLERILSEFRARSQLMASRLDDSDEVLQQNFSDDSFDGPIGDVSDIKMTNTNKSGTFKRNISSRGTYRVSKPKFSPPKSSSDMLTKSNHILGQTDDEKLSKLPVPTHQKDSQSTTESQRQLQANDRDIRQSTLRVRDLAINIKMKEQLIKELVKSEKDASIIHKQYDEKMKHLEHEKQTAKQELLQIQKAMQDAEGKSQADRKDKEKLQKEFRKRMEAAKAKLTKLTKKQNDTQVLATLTGTHDKRIHNLENAIDKMRYQHDELQQKLKSETDLKHKLEREITKEKVRYRELELKNEQQSKVLKVKTEDLAAAQRRLRSAPTAARLYQKGLEEQNKFEEKKRWLDDEMEKMLEERQKMEELQKALEQKEVILAKREDTLAQRNELEMKKMRSSQILSKDLKCMSARLASVDEKVRFKEEEAMLTPRGEIQNKVHDELRTLSRNRDRLKKQREVLDDKLQVGALLSPAEERQLLELDEVLETLDAAIEYKNEAIANREREIRASRVFSDDSLMTGLSALTANETRILLSRYFDKLLILRETERKKEIARSELEMQVEEQQNQITELESSLQSAIMETERQLTKQQHEHESKVGVLMRQLMEAESRASERGSFPSHGESDSFRSSREERKDVSIVEKDTKIGQLEKDLAHYKKTSRELKKKLRELLAGIAGDVKKDGANGLNDEVYNEQSLSSLTTSKNSPLLSPQTAQLHHSSGDMPKTSHSTKPLDTIQDGPPLHRSSGPVRISRKDLRRVSNEELVLRRSAVNQKEPVLTDSLEL